MERTEYTTSAQLQESPVKTREVEQRYSLLRDTARRMASGAGDLGALEAALLDGVIAFLDCERASLVCLDEDSATEYAPTVSASRVVVRRDETGRCVETADQADPEFSLHHSLIKESVRKGVPVLVKDCLGEPASRGIEVAHSAVCYPFDLIEGQRGVLYAARSVGEPSFGDEELRQLEDFALLCLPILQRAVLRNEVSRLGDGSGGGEREGPVAGGAEDAEDGDPWNDEDEIPMLHGIVGRSSRLAKIFELVDKIKDTDFNVCIIGESGTGKELLARAIHLAGKRRDGQFISENCGAISETLLESELFGYVRGAFTGADENKQGLFELAHGGTLFLDEIGDMSEGMQRKLLRVLQEGVIRPIGSKKVVEVDVRVLCASNRDLRQLVESGSFRADLYYRLNVITIEVPPLRERMEDIPYLVRHFLGEITREEGVRRRLSESALKALLSYSWPGNIRELTNVLRRVIITGKRRTVTRKEVLPLLSGGPTRSYVGEGADEVENQIVLRIPRRTTFNEIISECEKAVLLNALRENRWNKSRVTKVLQIPRQSLYNKISKYNLKRTSPRTGVGL